MTVATEPSANIDSHSSPVLTKMATLSEFEPPSGLRARSSPNLRADASLPAPINQLSRTRSVISWTPCFSGLEGNEHSTERPSSPRELLSTRALAGTIVGKPGLDNQVTFPKAWRLKTNGRWQVEGNSSCLCGGQEATRFAFLSMRLVSIFQCLNSWKIDLV